MYITHWIVWIEDEDEDEKKTVSFIIVYFMFVRVLSEFYLVRNK